MGDVREVEALAVAILENDDDGARVVFRRSVCGYLAERASQAKQYREAGKANNVLHWVLL
jgi:hypothetical protein